AAAVAVWTAFALAGADIAPGARFAASRAVDTVAATSSRTVAALREQAAFEQARRADPFRDVPAEELLAGLDGKDVVIAFVESYGRAAVEGTTFSAGVGRVLEDGGRQLERDGYSARSAFLTSPTFGGVSWLAHATLQSGLWVDSQLKYDQVTSTDRLTLAGAFGAAGWRTVADVPSNGAPWSVGASFYGYDAQLNARNVGYRGPAFSYARVPDQYTWKHFFDRELAAPHEPVMAEIDLVSSHTPWTPLPELVPWDELGDGSVFDPQPSRGLSPAEAWSDPKTVQRLYGESIEYSFGAMFSFLHEHDQPGLVLVVLGDHQPARIVSGPDAAADVPVTIIAQDRAVLDRIASWGWDEGVRPSPDAPVWRMDAFRDRFFRAFGAE
ncbi:CDP-alcohol phosphatidyltransferase, partial [Microbacterium ulmi]